MGRCWRECDATPRGMDWHVPPKNQGQIVTVSYGCCNSIVYCHWYDASDREEHTYWRDWKKSDGDCDFNNRAPEPTRVCGSERYL